MDKEDKFFFGVLLGIAILMMLLGFWSDAKAAVPYYSDERAIYEAGIMEGERRSDRLIYEAQFVPVASPSLEPPLPSFWEACLNANPKLKNERMDMFNRLHACTAWNELDRRIKIIAGWRSQEEHDRNVKKGTSKVKRSLHQDGQAWDWTWCKNKKCTRVIGGKVSDSEYDQLVYISGQIIGIKKFMKYFYRGFYSARDRVCSGGGDFKCKLDIKGQWHDWWHIQCPPYNIAKMYACKREPHPLDYL